MTRSKRDISGEVMSGMMLRLLLLLASSLMVGCIDPDLDRAERSVKQSHQELKRRLDAKESTKAALRSLSSSQIEQQRQSRNLQYHQLAKSGEMGVGEQLIVARKMLDDPSYENRLIESQSTSKREADFAASRREYLESELQQDKSKLREYLPIAKAAVDAYETVLQAQELKSGKRPAVSPQVNQMLLDIKAAMVDDERDRAIEKILEKVQKIAAKKQ